MFLLQRAETYVFHIRSTLNSGSSLQLRIAAHIIIVHFSSFHCHVGESKTI